MKVNRGALYEHFSTTEFHGWGVRAVVHSGNGERAAAGWAAGAQRCISGSVWGEADVVTLRDGRVWVATPPGFGTGCGAVGM